MIDSGSEHAEGEPVGDGDVPEEEDEDAEDDTSEPEDEDEDGENDTSESGTPRIREETGWRWRMNARPRTSIGDGAIEVASVCRL